MDKDTLRIIILLIGVLIVVGMIAWSFLKHQRAEQEFEDYDDSLAKNDDSSIKEHHDSEPVPIRATKNTKKPSKGLLDPISADVEDSEVPSLIQFSIIATTEKGFNGEDIFLVLNEVGLEYGSLQIFERLDSNRLVDFAVANMVNPGIFPKDNLTDFYCPGLSFFMQPKKIIHRVEVFEDFVRTLNFISFKLNGQMLDSKYEGLTNETIQQIRQTL